MRAARFTTVLVMVSIINACALLTTPEPQLPRLALSDARLMESGMLTQRWRLEWALTNPNESKLAVQTLVYDIHLHGEAVATEQRIEALELAPGETRMLEVPLTTHLGTSLQRLRRADRQPGDPVPWMIRGKVTLREGDAPQPLERQGRLHLPVIP